MVLSAIHVLTCRLQSATKMLFLTGWLETQITGEQRLLQFNYIFLSETNIDPAQW